MKTVKSKIKRTPARGIYDKEEIYKILDKEFLCHVGFIYQHYPVVIPTLFGRKGDELYVHGSSASRLIKSLATEMDMCLSVAGVSGIVLARSAFHHSMNYESVVVFGRGKLVPDSEKEDALKIISDHILPGRWEEVRKPNRKELKATKVIRIRIDEASAKRRTGDPKDEKEDMDLKIWAGVLPVIKSFGNPQPDSNMVKKYSLPESIRKALYPS